MVLMPNYKVLFNGTQIYVVDAKNEAFNKFVGIIKGLSSKMSHKYSLILFLLES